MALDLTGTQIDVLKEFEFIGVLGQGSFGEVFKAKHKTSNKLIAIKKQNIKESDNSELIREVKIMESLKSPYIVGYYGSSLERRDKGDVMWIVMEYCCYGSVNDMMILTKKTLNEHQIATLCRACLEGLSYMITVNKIHRDIKPHNILVNEKGEAKLCDFGISSDLLPGQQRKTVIGTPYYLAPEIIQEDGYDQKCDVWALGISAIEMAEYNPPFHDAHPMRVLFMIPSNPSPTLTNPEHWSPDFNDFIARCVRKLPADRETPSELLQHDFIRNKAHLQTLSPYLKQVASTIDTYGSLDNALREIRSKPEAGCDSEDDNLDGFDEKEMFGEFSPGRAGIAPDNDDDFPDEHFLFTGSDEEGSDPEDSDELKLDSTDDDELNLSEEEESEKDLDALFQMDVRQSEVPPMNLNQLPTRFPEKQPAKVSPMIRSKNPVQRTGAPATPTSMGLSARGNIPRIRLVGKLPESNKTDMHSAREVLANNQIDIERLHNIDSHQPEEPQNELTFIKLKADAIAEQMRQKLDEHPGYEDFKQYYPDHKASNFRGQWRGLYLVKNPWRNHQQYKVSISQPTILCIVISTDYRGKDSIPMLANVNYEGAPGMVSVSVIAVKDTSRQLVQKPRSIHTKHDFKEYQSNYSIQVYLEDADMKYVIVPTVSLLGDASIEYQLQIMYHADVAVKVEELPMMKTQFIQGGWTRDSSGGTIDGIDWRRNPQYLLEVWEPTNLLIYLAQHIIQPKLWYNIGFYVIKITNERRKKLLTIDYEQLLVKGQGWLRAQEITSRSPLVVDKGLYVILPCTYYPRKEANFTLTIASESLDSFAISQLPDIYNERICDGAWTPEQSGGCTQNPEWINNPRFLLSVPNDLSISFFVDRKPWANRQHRDFVGIYLFKAKNHQYATLSKNQLIGKTKHFSDAKEVAWKVKKIKKGNYILLVSTFSPGGLGKFIFRAYSTELYHMEPLPIPPLHTIKGEWNQTNCGGAFNFGAWRKNPQYFLKYLNDGDTPVKVEIILQTEPEKKMIGDDRDQGNITPFVGFYVFRSTSDSPKKIMKINKGAVVKITDFQKEKRVADVLKLVPRQGLIIMPTSFEPDINARFSLSIAGLDNKEILFSHVSDKYKYYIHKGKWSVSEGTAGGCHNFSKGASEQWLDNPRIIMCSKKDTVITVVLKQDPKEKPPIVAGIYVLSAKKGTKLSKRSVLTYSEFCASPEVVVEDFKLQKGEFYMLLLTGYNPGEENSFTVELYSTRELVWKPVLVKNE